LGIAIGCLCEKNEHNLVEWTKSVGASPLHYPNANIEQLLRLIIGVKQLTINEVDKTNDVDLDSDDSEAETKNPKAGPSTAAIEKLEDFSGYITSCQSITHTRIVIPYTEDGHATAATRNQHLKLLFTLIGFQIIDKSRFQSINHTHY
jgi:replication fork protection complex subunit Tof1/Swi1